jgi:hypothetical protein
MWTKSVLPSFIVGKPSGWFVQRLACRKLFPFGGTHAANSRKGMRSSKIASALLFDIGCELSVLVGHSRSN